MKKKFWIPMLFLASVGLFAAPQVKRDKKQAAVIEVVEDVYADFTLNVRKNFSGESRDRVEAAAALAGELHQGQKRDGGLPYIIHPISVANHLMTIAGVKDPDVIIAALLHDTVEDTGVTLCDIERHFGITVSGYVAEVTDDPALTRAEQKEAQIKSAPKKSRGAALIKMADRLDNLRSLNNNPPKNWDAERVAAYFAHSNTLIDALLAVSAKLKKAVDREIALQYSLLIERS